MGPENPKDVTKDTARDLDALVEELAALKGAATYWVLNPEYEVLRYRLEAAPAEAVSMNVGERSFHALG